MLHSKDPTILDSLIGTIGELDGVSSSILMGYVYDVMYYVHNHYAKAKPLAQVAMNTKEKMELGDPLSKSIEDFRTYDIAKYYGYNFTEWLELPFDTAQQILKTLRGVVDKERKVADKAQRDLDASKRSLEG